MAELLLYYRDPERGYEIGDIISAAPDGSTWGSMECVYDFLVVRLPGMPIWDAHAYIQPLERETNTGLWRHAWSHDGYTEPTFEMVSRRRWKLDINSSMAASGIDPDAFGLVYCEDWLVHEITAPVWADKAAA